MCCLAHRGSADDSPLLQILSDLQLPGNKLDMSGPRL